MLCRLRSWAGPECANRPFVVKCFAKMGHDSNMEKFGSTVTLY